MAKKKKRKTTPARVAKTEKVAARPWWERQPDAMQHGICLVVLVVVAGAFFAPSLFSSKTLVGGDIVSWKAVAESMLEHRAATGEEPLWATNTFGGMPGYLISFPRKIPQIDQVADGLRRVIWPVSHFLFLLLGAYLLLFFLTKDKWSSVLAACAYGLTTYLPVILIAGHNTKFIALCYAPWVVLAFVYALRKPGLLAGLFFALVLAVNLRANHVQITYYLAFMLGVWWIVEGVGAIRKGEGRTFGVATAWLMLGAVLALLMVAQPYLSNYEYKAFSIRGVASGGAEGALDWSYAMAWSQGIGEMVTLLMADAYGGSTLYWGPKTFTGGPHYVGGIVLLLAALALWRYRRRTVWALGLGGLLMTFFALGENFEVLNRLMYEYFPLFDIFRVPETWLSVVALILAILAGMGLFYVVRREPSKDAEHLKTKAVYLASGVAVGVVLVLFLGKGLFFDFKRADDPQRIARQVLRQQPGLSLDDPQVQNYIQQSVAQLEEARSTSFTGDALRTLIFLLLAAGALVAFRKEKVPGWVMQAVLVLLVAIDLGGVGHRYYNGDRLAEAPDPAAQIPTYDFDRFILEKQEEAGGSGHFRVLSLEAFDQTGNARPSYHYESLGGYSAVKLRLYQDYLDHLLFDPQTRLPNDNALDLLNTRYVAAPQPLPGMEVVFQGETTGFYVLENTDPLPRAFFVGETEVIEQSEETWARLRSPAFDPRQTALLSEPLDLATTPIDSSSTVSVALQRYGPREVAWAVETDAPRLLVVSELYYPAGWQATVDGEPASIYRTDYLLRSVPVPAGAHEVVMRFEPRSYALSLWLSGLSTVVVYSSLLALLGLAWYRRRDASTDEIPPSTLKGD